MRVILLKDVEKLGKADQIVDVKPGYARNFLIPKGLAEKATPAKIKKVQKMKKEQEEKQKQELQKAQQLASKIDGLELVISVKTGDGGQLYESVNELKIAKELKSQNIKIKESQVKLEKPIKELGEFPVKISFEHNLEAEITVVVEEEKE